MSDKAPSTYTYPIPRGPRAEGIVQRMTLADVGAEIDRINTDNARLRALVKAGEWGDRLGSAEDCPWCSVNQRSRHGEHYDHCPAFTPNGEVK